MVPTGTSKSSVPTHLGCRITHRLLMGPAVGAHPVGRRSQRIGATYRCGRDMTASLPLIVPVNGKPAFLHVGGKPLKGEPPQSVKIVERCIEDDVP